MTGIEQLNNAARAEAFASLLDCCGATAWAQRMVAARPFADVAALLAAAERIWWELRPDDWLEAFASHPRIGERKAAQNQSAQASQWSEAEQAGARNAADETLMALAAANQTYEEKFGYIYIVCATGKSTEEVLTTCHERLGNDAETELRTAAEAQRKITEIRLKKLIGATESEMSAITTHVLDTALGRPARGVPVVLELQTAAAGWQELGQGATDDDGRLRTLLAPDHQLQPGSYRLTFDTGAYFAQHNRESFYPQVTVIFTVQDAAQHYHVPLLLSPFGYATYRGS